MTNYIFQPSSSVAKNKSERKQRILYGVLIGFVAGTIAAISSSFINVWLYPEFPIYFEWPSVFLAWILWAFICGLLAGIAVISLEGWTSILLSAFCMAATILIINFVQDLDNIFLNLLILLGLSLPFTAMMTPLAYIFFWLTLRFIQALSENGWARARIFFVNFLVIIVLGAIPGLYAKMDANAEQGVRLVHGILQDAAQAQVHKALLKTEGRAEHKDQPYKLSQVPSLYSTVGVDVTAHYEDGYTILCTVILYPGSDPFISPCKGTPP